MVLEEIVRKRAVKGGNKFQNGKKDGALRRWHENGQLRYQANFKDGKITDGGYVH